MEPYSLLKLIRAFALGLLLTLFFGWSLPSVSTTMTTSTPTNLAQPLMDAQSFAKQGRDLYETGHFSEAATAWEQAAKAYQYQGDGANHALALSNLALTYQQLGRWQKAEATIATSLQQLRSTPDISYAQALDIDGHLKFAQGKPEKALELWQQANEIYDRIGDKAGQIANQLNQAQALQSLGLFLQSENLFKVVDESLEDSRVSPSLRAKELRTYGEVLRSVGKLEESQTALDKSHEIAKTLSSPQRENAISATLLSLGNTQRAIAERTREIKAANEYKEAEECKTYLAEGEELLDAEGKKLLAQVQQALNSYEAAAKTAKDVSPFTQVQAQINQLSLLRELNRKLEPDSQELLNQILSQISSLPSSRAAVYAQINLAQTLSCFKPSDRPTIAEILKFDLPDRPTIAEILDVTLPDRSTIAQILKAALQQAQSLNDKRAESNAIGNLGHLYEQNQQLPEAQKLTQKALLIAQSINAPYITYRWQWQLGRILAKGTVDKQKQVTNVAANGDQYKSAIAAYSEAVETLKSIRSDLLAITQDLQFSFRDNIEPVYRELLALLLPQDEKQSTQENLQKAFYYTESLQVAELENFFQCGLQNTSIEKININAAERDSKRTIDALVKQMDEFLAKEPKESKSAIIYPVLVQDLGQQESRLAVIVKLFQQDFKYKSTQNIDPVRETLKDARSTVSANQDEEAEFLPPKLIPSLSKLYKWLIEPFADSFERAGIKTLAFIPDSALRSIPMAALVYDDTPGKEHYLVETNYAVALAPSLQLLRSDYSRPATLKPLIAGIKLLDKDKRLVRFAALDSEQQTKPIYSMLKDFQKKTKAFSQSKVISLTRKSFETEIKLPFYNMVHLVTHGEFQNNLQTTFVLTDDSLEEEGSNVIESSLTSKNGGDKAEHEERSKLIELLVQRKASIDIGMLTNWIQTRKQQGASPIDLFLLSACKTADGSSRVVLGMAGFAVKSGARATVAPLWSVAQNSVNTFMPYFYEELGKHPGENRAIALKNAQKRLKNEKRYKAPYHWAAYVLVGNY